MDRKLVPSQEEWASIREYLDTIEKAGYMPLHLQGNREKQLAIALRAWEIEIPISQALEQFYEADGRLTMSAELMRAVIAKSGVGLIVPIRIDSDGAAVRAVRYVPGAEPQTAEFTFTLDDARRAGLEAQLRWQQYPGPLCLARVTSLAARAMFADVLGGMSYVPEELAGIRQGTQGAVATKPKSHRKAGAKLDPTSELTPTPEPQPGVDRGAESEGQAEIGVGAASEMPLERTEKPVEARSGEDQGLPLGRPESGAVRGSNAVSPSGEVVLGCSFIVPDGAGGTRTLRTAGVTPEQLRMIKRFAEKDARCLVIGKAYLAERGLKSTAYLTESQAAELIESLRNEFKSQPSPVEMIRAKLVALDIADTENEVHALIRETLGKSVQELSTEEATRLCYEITDLARDREAFRFMLQRTLTQVGKA